MGRPQRRDLIRGLAVVMPMGLTMRFGVAPVGAIPGDGAGRCVGPQRGEDGQCPPGWYRVGDYSYCRPEHNPCADEAHLVSKKYGRLRALCCAKPTKRGKARWGCADTDTDRTYHVCKVLPKKYQPVVPS